MQPPQYYSRFSQTAFSSGGNLPHWSQTCATFVTFRLADSLPEMKLAAFREERADWLKAHPEPWDEATAAAYRENFPQKFHQWLDAGYGSCILAEEELRKIVEEALWHGAEVDAAGCGCEVLACGREVVARGRDVVARGREVVACGRDCLNRVIEDGQIPPDAFGTNASTRDGGQRTVLSSPDAFGTNASTRDGGERTNAAKPRYSLYAYVVMPNHVHVLFMPAEGEDSRRIVSEWKRYTARMINARRGVKGSVWQKESYDHLVRDVKEFNACRSYIRGNAQELAFDAYAD